MIVLSLFKSGSILRQEKFKVDVDNEVEIRLFNKVTEKSKLISPLRD